MPILRWRETGSLALLALLVSTSAPAGEPDAEKVFREARGYTVRIRTQVTTPFITDTRGSFEGAGFLVDAARGWILTNAHVVAQSPSEVQVAFADEDFQAARKVYVDCFADVAVLAVGQVGPGRKIAKLNVTGEVSIGEPVGAFGHPLGMYFTGTRGIVSGKTDQFGPDLIQIDATVDHGNSGGPLIALRDGRVVGIATAGAGGDKSDRVNFATPMKDVGRILDLLRRGVMPSPPFMPFALLRDETDRHTLEIARSFDARNWPLEPGDLILGVQGHAGELETMTDLVSALRGRTGKVGVRIEREGKAITLDASPVATPLVTEARGISLDGALIAPIPFEDETNPNETPRLIVHSLEPGSTAQMLGIDTMDLLHTVDGRSFGDLASLDAYLRERPEDEPLRIVFCRTSAFVDRWFDYIVREMPGKDIRSVGRHAGIVSAKD
jgi:S1-C subfamily serine protease